MIAKQISAMISRKLSFPVHCRFFIGGFALVLFSAPLLAQNQFRIISAKNLITTPPTNQDDQVDEREQKLSRLIEAAQAAKDRFEPVSPARAASAKRELRAAMTRVEALLSGNTAEVRESWNAYLDWPALQREIQAENPSASVFNAAIRKLSINQPGIEDQAFINLRGAMTEFKNASVYASLANLEGFYGQTLDRLIALLQTEIQTPSLQNANDIGRIAGILDDSNQADELLQQIRDTFSQSNMVVTVSERAMCEISASQSVRNTSPVRENILDTPQIGTAETHGNLLVDLVPSNNMAEIIVSLDGVTDSDVVGTRDVPVFGQIEIYSKGKTRVHAATPIYVDGQGFSNGYAEAETVNRNKLVGVCSPTLIRQIVKREVHKQSDKGNFIATQRAQLRVQQNMNEQVAEALGKANARFEQNFLTPLARLDATPQRLAFSTSEETLMFEMLEAGNYQVGAMVAAPKLNQTGDLVVQIHESLLANSMENILARKSVTSEQVAKLNAGKKKLDGEQKPWKITFFSVQPVQVSFRDNLLGVAILIREIEEAGETAVNRPLLISATFQLAKTAQGLALLRQGPVDLTYRGDAPASVRESAVKGNLAEPLQALFPERIDIQDIKFPEDGQLRGKASFKHLEFADGWMSGVVDLDVE